MSSIDSSDVVPSGYGEISKRRGVEISRAALSGRAPQQKTARGRNAGKGKKGRQAPVGPTAARLAKDDIHTIRTAGVDYCRAITPVERLRDQGKLAPKTPEQLKALKPGDLSYDLRENNALYEAALKLRRHFDGCMIGVKAQDVDRAIIGGAPGDLVGEEAWVFHFDTFRTACKMMGWFEHAPRRGNGRLVVAVVCQELAVYEAATQHIGGGRKEVVLAAGMDRLREGLFALAVHWRFL